MAFIQRTYLAYLHQALLLAAASCASIPCHADTVAQVNASLPLSFTVTYHLTSEDMRSPSMRLSEAQSYVVYWQNMLRQGIVTPENAQKYEAYSLASYSKPIRPESYTLTVSSDGSHLLCDLRNENGNAEEIGIYGSDSRTTYFVDISNGSPQVTICKGFNYTAMQCIPLLPYNEPDLDLYFMKDAKPPGTSGDAASSAQSESGLAPVSAFEGEGAVSAVPYSSGTASMTTGQDGLSVPSSYRNFWNDGTVASSWQYAGYTFSGALRAVPRHISWRWYKTFILGQSRQDLAKFDFEYNLLSVSASSVDAKHYDVNYWLNGNKSSVAQDQTVFPPVLFMFDASHSRWRKPR